MVKSETRLDEFLPVWHFRERHSITVDAPPQLVYRELKEVRAEEITFFQTLTWIRRGGRALPESILNARSQRPLLEIATQSGFIYLAEDAPKEIVIGTAVVCPRGHNTELTPELFKSALAPGFVLGAFNFVVSPTGKGTSIVTTETRVFATSDRARRRFAVWFLIHPGSAIIRRMWLRAVRRRAMKAVLSSGPASTTPFS